MIYWLIVITLAYLFFALASLGDKLVLSGKPNPKSYTFYIGFFSISALLFIPFIKFGFPNTATMFWAALDAIVNIIGLYTMFVAVKKFDVSRVIPTIGATQPIFIFILAWIFWGYQPTPLMDILAFIILLAGTIVISVSKNLKFTGDYLKITLLSSLMFALDYIFSKSVYLNTPFLQGIIWIRIFMFLFALIFLIKKNSREEIFSKKMVSDRKTQMVFVYAQACGGLATLMQSFAISLVPISFLAIVNSLRGIQYVFLFLITLFISYFFPKILKEELSKKIVFQKIISIILIAVGLAILVVYQ